MKKNILVGICGGIAAYKTAELIRLLVRDGFSVKVVMTEGATHFVGPLTFETLTAQKVYLDLWQGNRDGITHIALTQWAHLCVVAPLSANTLSKVAHGICDNLLTTVLCALSKTTKVVLAPAMNHNMWGNPIIKANLKRLKQIKNYIVLDPPRGVLACGEYGEGRMPDPKDIYKKIKEVSVK